MGKTYQPFIIERANEIMEVLKEDVPQTEQMKNRLCDILTEKFIAGEISSSDPMEGILTFDELFKFMNEGAVLNDIINLVEYGLVGKYEDENGEISYYLTDAGKEYVKNIKKEE